MSLYRVKQFYWSITSKVTIRDIEFIKEYLSSDEQKLFFKLSINEQKHSINVAREVKKECDKVNRESKVMVKAALLHDIGKIYKKLNVIDKSIIVILDNITDSRIRKMKRIKKIDIYYNHAEKGYELLKSLNYDDKTLYLIRNHHSENDYNDADLEILRKCDNKN